MRLKTVNDLIFKALRQSGMKTQSDLMNLQLSWENLVGPVNAQHSFPYSLNNKTLLVKTADEKWQKIFRELVPMLKEKISNEINENAVTRMKIYKDVAFFMFKGPRKVNKGRRSPLTLISIDKNTREKMNESLAGINDNELKNILERIWLKDLTRKNTK